MSEAAAPVVQPDGKPPVAPTATPAAVETEKVTLSKEEADQLKRDAARAASNQRKADLYDRMNGGKNGSHFKPSSSAAPVVAPSAEEREAAASAEDRKAERALMALAADPAYREVLDADPTLRTLLMTNPLGALPILAPEAVDAEDALSLVKEALGKRKPAAVAPVTPVAPTKPATPPAPPAGGVNPQATGTDEEYETARKIPNTENAIAAMVRSKAAKIGKE